MLLNLKSLKLAYEVMVKSSVEMTVPAHSHGYMPRHQIELKLSRFFGVKKKKKDKKFLLKNFFPKNNKEKNS